MTIPDAAVEAAAKADYGDGWDRASEWERSAYLDHSKQLLEAAAPHMLAEVRDGARQSREQARKLDAVTSIAVKLGASNQCEDREIAEDLYAAMGLK